MKKCCGTCKLGGVYIDTSWFNWTHKEKVRCLWPQEKIILPSSVGQYIMDADDGWNCPCWKDWKEN